MFDPYINEYFQLFFAYLILTSFWINALKYVCLREYWIKAVDKNKICPVLANSVHPDQLASKEANWSGSALFSIKNVNFDNNLDQVIWLAEN